MNMLSMKVALGLVAAFACGAYADEAPRVSDEAVGERHGLSVEEVQRLRYYRKLTNEHMLEMSSFRIGKILWRLDNNRSDLPLAAAEFRMLQQAVGSGPAAAAAIGDAVDKVKTQRARIRDAGAPTIQILTPRETLSGISK